MYRACYSASSESVHIAVMFSLRVVSFPGSPSSACVCNMTFDPVEIAESKVILRAHVEEGEPGNEAN